MHPAMMQAQGAADRELFLELAGQSRMYCEKWGMKAGTVQHANCLEDIQVIRDQQKNRDLADASLF
jgi:hypothetical protein